MSIRAPRTGRLLARTTLLCAIGTVISTAGCAAGNASAPRPSQPIEGRVSEITVQATSSGCPPHPGFVREGTVEVHVANRGAASIWEVELRSWNFSHLIGEKENLLPGLSGAFSVTLRPGDYIVYCPGATTAEWQLTVSG